MAASTMHDIHVPTLKRARLTSHGFSLVEMAIVLLILGILMSGIIVAVGTTTAAARRSATLSQLRQVEDALYGFAQSQGRLPCPATITSNGYEQGTAGACAQSEGFVPNATLGLYGQVDSNGVLVDSWQNPLGYAVVKTAAPTLNPDFTSWPDVKSFFNNGTAIIANANMLRICSDIAGGSCSAANVISDIAPAAVFSRGANNFPSGNETENADADTIFVSTTYSDEQFDDQLVWLSPYILFNRMISAGKLP